MILQGEYTMRSYSAFSAKPKRSKPIVKYSASALSAVTIDSPTSFVAQGLKPNGITGYFATQVPPPPLPLLSLTEDYATELGPCKAFSREGFASADFLLSGLLNNA